MGGGVDIRLNDDNIPTEFYVQPSIAMLLTHQKTMCV